MVFFFAYNAQCRLLKSGGNFDGNLIYSNSTNPLFMSVVAVYSIDAIPLILLLRGPSKAAHTTEEAMAAAIE